MFFKNNTLLFLLCLCAACGQPESTNSTSSVTSEVATQPDTEMKAVIQKSTFYKTIPSASGLEEHNGQYYVIGDDSPYLYVLDKQFKEINRIALSDTTGFASGRVKKEMKQDLESIAKLTIDGKAYLLILGSGASPARQQAYLVLLQDSKEPAVQKYSLEKLYQKLQQDKRVVNEGLLNIEGVAAGNGKLYLMQRALGTGNNILITFELTEFLSFLKDESKGTLPAYTLSVSILEQLQGFTPGFSGAYFFDDKLFFTASVESTTNAIDDGEVLGSFIGFIPAAGMEPMAAEPANVAAALITKPDGSVYKGKVESLVVVEKMAADNKYKVLAVTDDDQGHSELLEIDFQAEP